MGKYRKMIKSQLLQVTNQQNAYFIDKKQWINRTVFNEIPVGLPKAIVLSGIRRSGKSTLMKLLHHQKKTNAAYLHFDDPRLSDFEVADFYTLEEIWTDKQQFQYDEIQQVKGWEKYVRHAVERKKQIYITGSNAQLLSKELGTLLTGRHLTFELFPFSYKEYLNFKKQKPCKTSFDGYFKAGGFPEALKYKMPTYHHELYNDIVQRDIAVRYRLRNLPDFNKVALHLINNLARPFTLSRMAKNYQIKSVKSVVDYTNMLVNAYLIYIIPRFTYSVKKQQNNPKKVYIVDHAFAKQNSTQLSDDFGRILENMVYMHLRHTHPEIYYFQEKNECDFVVVDKGKHHLYQVCWQLDRHNKDREFNGLAEAMQFFNLKKAKLITYNEEDSYKIKGIGKVEIIPFWKWMGT